MNPPERLPSDSPREWMNRAQSNLALAKYRMSEHVWNNTMGHTRNGKHRP